MVYDIKEATQFLIEQGVPKDAVQVYLATAKLTKIEYIPFTALGYDYAIHHFLDLSDTLGFGLFPTNKQLRLVGTEFTAIALVEGDDIVCIEAEKGFIYLWLLQTGNGEKILIANSINEFLKMSVR